MIPADHPLAGDPDFSMIVDLFAAMQGAGIDLQKDVRPLTEQAKPGEAIFIRGEQPKVVLAKAEAELEFVQTMTRRPTGEWVAGVGLSTGGKYVALSGSQVMNLASALAEELVVMLEAGYFKPGHAQPDEISCLGALLQAMDLVNETAHENVDGLEGALFRLAFAETPDTKAN